VHGCWLVGLAFVVVVIGLVGCYLIFLALCCLAILTSLPLASWGGSSQPANITVEGGPMDQVKVPSIIHICLEPVTAMENENDLIHSLLPAVVLAVGRSTEMRACGVPVELSSAFFVRAVLIVWEWTF
jgi:hypothetical protein